MSATTTTVPTTASSKNTINEDDPDALLNEWLGELENLIGVSLVLFSIHIFHLYIHITYSVLSLSRSNATT